MFSFRCSFLVGLAPAALASLSSAQTFAVPSHPSRLARFMPAILAEVTRY